MSTNSSIRAVSPTQVESEPPAKRRRLLQDEDEAVELGTLVPDESSHSEDEEPTWSYAQALSNTSNLLELPSARSFKELLFSVIKSDDKRDEVIKFASLPALNVAESQVPVTEWHGKENRADWDVHCPEIDSAWRDFVKGVEDTADGSVRIDAMSAPSGPLRSKATFLWHYPTTTLLHGLSQNDRFIFTVGKWAHVALKKLWTSTGKTIEDVALSLPAEMFHTKPKLCLVKDSDSNIVQLIIPVYHGQFAFNNFREKVGAQWDLIYNAGCELADIPVVNPGLFTRMSKRDPLKSILQDRDNPWQSWRVDRIMAISYESGNIIPAQVVITAFAHIVKSLPELEREILACEERGHPPIAALSDYFVKKNQTKAANANQRKAKEAATEAAEDGEVGAPSGSRYKKRVFADRSANGSYKQLISKYNAIMNTYEAKTALAQRHSPDKKHRIALGIRRLDRLTKIRDQYIEAPTRAFSTALTQVANWKSKAYPDGLEFAVEDTRWPNEESPLVYVLNKALGNTHNKPLARKVEEIEDEAS
ncbi:hypothetical protein LMH87_004382 [Akanthomyces muscarius]|uniref:Uncharacterized protein n=1 Tax=Akanthomyces muscarius TaxID=2231603 RepID=A0A9W8Q3Q3_AKAMU|nr:hypothetical protein LMH87_004382 [Akanthomyces muscarius]KAJ4145534.1 hypothetical protein LMH87_004382 [Akanthomyces muscarius]